MRKKQKNNVNLGVRLPASLLCKQQLENMTEPHHGRERNLELFRDNERMEIEEEGKMLFL